MKEILVNDNLLIDFIKETRGKKHWDSIKNLDKKRKGQTDLCLAFFRSLATKQEVINDLADIEEKYYKLIAKRFFDDNMTNSEKEHILVKSCFAIFFHDYIQEYPDKREVCNGITDALNVFDYLLVYQENGEIIDLHTKYLKKPC